MNNNFNLSSILAAGLAFSLTLAGQSAKLGSCTLHYLNTKQSSFSSPKTISKSSAAIPSNSPKAGIAQVLTPEDGEAFLKMLHQAATLQEMGKIKDAAALYKNILRRDAKNVVALNNLALILERLGKNSEAEEIWIKAIKLDPKDVQAYVNLAALYIKTKHYADAEKFFQHAIAIDPDYAYAYNNLAVLYKIRGDSAKALEYFRKAAETAPTPEFLYNLASAYYESGDYKKATKHLREVLANDKDHPAALYSLALINLNNACKLDERVSKAEFGAYYQRLKQCKPDLAEEFARKYIPDDNHG